ncbi:MAG TPA: YqeG family HAD IIIA-type phosphatase [Clostridiales bacterium UBA8153]|nr:YqeG family HAD IIIA-type phosphatase [Clostridiales bacterium UBA8153]
MRGLARWFCPHEYLSSPYAVDFGRLQERGVCGLIVDLDNTLVGYDQVVPGPGLQEWMQRARDAGMALCILTNNHRRERVTGLARSLGTEVLARAGKPRRRPFRKAMERMGTAPGTTAVIGDQLFTDVLGGKRAGLYTILVRPNSDHEFIGTRLIRVIERRMLRHFVKAGMVTMPRPRPSDGSHC